VFNQFEFKVSEKCKLFDTMISSILNYCSEIWGGNEGKDIELIHTKFCRKILVVNNSTNLIGLYGELGRFPMKIVRKVNMIRYWCRIQNLNGNSAVKHIYNMIVSDLDRNITYNGSNWAFQIKTMLDNLGMSDIWRNQGNQEYILNAIKQRIFDQYTQFWYSEINNSQRLLTYSRFKHSFELESYLDNYSIDKKFKIALTRFRLSSHNLEIERGRYNNVIRSERICQFCNLNVVENEYHFLLTCPLYSNIRKKYLRRNYYTWPSLNKFDHLMMTKNKKEIANLSKYLYFANKLRKELE
jgi:hypothetical protein